MGLKFADTVEKVLPAARWCRANGEAPIIETGLSFLLRHVVPPPTEMEHQVGGDALAPSLNTTLGIERVRCATELAKEVEGFEACRE